MIEMGYPLDSGSGRLLCRVGRALSPGRPLGTAPWPACLWPDEGVRRGPGGPPHKAAQKHDCRSEVDTHLIDIRAGDRVLLLSMPDIEAVREMARKASAGIVVGLGEDDEVRAARKALGQLENVMFVPATTEEIPWQENFFSVVIDTACAWSSTERTAREILRVLSPGGSAYVTPTARPALLALGFLDGVIGGPLTQLKKPGAAG